MLGNKEEEYKHAVKSQKKYDVLGALRDEIRELKNSLLLSKQNDLIDAK